MTQDEAHRLELLIVQGFATVRGDINALSIREDHNATHITELRTDVDELQARRFPLPTVGGIMGIAAVGLTVVSMVSGKG